MVNLVFTTISHRLNNQRSDENKPRCQVEDFDLPLFLRSPTDPHMNGQNVNIQYNAIVRRKIDENIK